MANGTYIDWGGTDKQVERNMLAYAGKVQEAILAVARYFEPIFESFAKENAPWQDRTANARQSLHSYVMEVSQGVVELYLSHGVHYGIYLETRFSGAYAIIWPTLEEHIPKIRAMLQGIFG
jgi:hypothetical protein